MTVSPTRRQLDLLRYIAGYREAKGYAPSTLDMMRGIGVSGGASINEGVKGLEERGLLRRLRYRARAIEPLVPVAIPRSPSGEPLFFIPIPNSTTPPPGQGE